MSLDWPKSDEELRRLASARTVQEQGASPDKSPATQHRARENVHFAQSTSLKGENGNDLTVRARSKNPESSTSPRKSSRMVMPAKGRAVRESRTAKELTPGQLRWLEQKAKSDKAAAEFKILCVAAGLPLPVREFRFAAPEREWEADFAWPDEKIILEVEGGAWSGGRHTRGSGYLKDMEKYNNATLRGYRLFRCTPSTLCKSATIELLKQAMEIIVRVK